MDSRSFTIGLICGVVIGALVVWLTGGSNGDEVFPGAEREANVTSVPEVLTSPPLAERVSQEPPSESNLEGSAPNPSVETTIDSLIPWPGNLRAELELEQKDDSWAYYMEQTLLQYLSAHPSIDQFDISSIECRTTTCLIAVIGFDESTVPVWAQVMYDIRQQPWNEFNQGGWSSGNVDGRLTIVGKFHRKPGPE
jgi:hypothetical protein